MELVKSRGMQRSGRAVVGLDVISQTLPRGYGSHKYDQRYQQNTHQPHHALVQSIPPPLPPKPSIQTPTTSSSSTSPHIRSPSVQPLSAEDLCRESVCSCCPPDVCSGEPSAPCTTVNPYPQHIYPKVVTRAWGRSSGGAEQCGLCNILVPTSYDCSDPFCGTRGRPPVGGGGGGGSSEGGGGGGRRRRRGEGVGGGGPCSCMQQMYRNTSLSVNPTQVPKASSDCSLPRLINVQGNFAANFTAALGRPPDGYHQHTSQSSQDVGPSYGHHQHNRALSNGKTQPSGSPRHAGPQSYQKGPPISRLSRSVEELPKDIKDHIQKCRCSCDHMGYGSIAIRTTTVS
ncbi:uncharacterized protein LOC135197147 [Macrobrachium nipponense]|uniref:uncharacterized protein LOC135197147 n=1 Tax=Macrobrachium nipponense TaxID=159736 RepID=UPI0030C8554F